MERRSSWPGVGSIGTSWPALAGNHRRRPAQGGVRCL